SRGPYRLRAWASPTEPSITPRGPEFKDCRQIALSDRGSAAAGGLGLGHPLQPRSSVPGILLGPPEELLRFGGIGPGEHPEATLLPNELLERDGRLPAVEHERRVTALRPPRVVP